jgi:hypothetical protein
MKRHLKVAGIIVALFAGFACNHPDAGHTYYVSSSAGNDANNGLSAGAAWQSLDKVNEQLFRPGDKILFCSGDEWKGQLRPKGSGAEGAPISIDKYGEGNLPAIDQEARAGAVVELENQEYWEIAGLEVTAGATTDDTVKEKQNVLGIHVIATTADHVLRHIIIRNCVVRNIYGPMEVYEGGGIWVGVPGWNTKPEGVQGVENPYGHPPSFSTSFDGVLIENNRVSGVDRCGILVWTTANPDSTSNGIFIPGLIPSKNVVVRGNTLEDVGGDAILIMGSDAPLVEKNVVRRSCKKAGNPAYRQEEYWAPSAAAVWFHHCFKGVIQHNAVYDSERLQYNFDGMAYDFDYNCERCVLQYNYSRNNRGGFLLLMGTAVNNVIRYNISENDHTHILFLVGSVEENNRIYNNTFYVDSDTTCIVPRAHIQNNIFMAEGNGKIEIRNWEHPNYTPWSPELGVMLNNCYAGNCAPYLPDTLRTVADPEFVQPGKAGNDAENLACYTLGAGSPGRKAGLIIPSNGGLDILGNRIPQDTPPDIGAVQSDRR